MWVYRQLDRLCPESYLGKLFLIAFVGTHVPLLGTLVFILSQRPMAFPLGLVVALVGSTLFGVIMTWFALRAVVSPISRASLAASDYQRRRSVPDLPATYRDEVGVLLRSVQTMIEEIEETITDTERLALFDPLTGLLNRRGLFAEWRSLASAPGGTSAVVMVLDVDRFKEINDTNGHAVGDRVLSRISAQIKSALGENDFAARLGGDEFVIVLPDRPSSGVFELSETIRHHARADDDVSVTTLSAGAVFQAAITERSLDEALILADKALYVAKGRGRNQLHVDDAA